MASRTVSVLLKAEIGQYVSSMAKAAVATESVGKSAETTGSKFKKSFDIAGKGAMLLGVGVGAALVGVVTKSMEFEKAMSAVHAATQATTGVMGDLRAAAIKAGADTQYSATEAADGITEMAKAGVSAKDIMGGGLMGALNLAAAGQISVADAAGIASTAMTQFGLKGAQIPHVADLLAAGAGKAMGSVSDLGMALNQSGLVASAAGLSIEETTGTLAAFASAGLLGSDAGTSLKTALQKLQAPSTQAEAVMSEYGISVYDANGKMLSMAGIAGQLKDHLGGLTQEQRNSALATIFGSDAVRAANVLYANGAKGIEDWTKKVNDAGYAQKQARDLTDNLSGDLERLGGSFDTLSTSIGAGVQGPLRDLVQMLTSVVNAGGDVISFFGSLPGPLQIAIVAALGWAAAGDKILAAIRPMGGMLGPLRGSWSAFGEAMGYAKANGDGLGTVLKSVGSYAGGAALSGLKALAKAIGPELGIAAAVYTVGQLIDGFKLLSGATDQAEAAAKGLADSLTLTDAAADRHSIRKVIEDTDGLVEVLSRAGVSSKDAINGLLGQAGATDRVSTAIQNYINLHPGGVHDKEATAALMAKHAYDELATGYGTAAGNARFFADQGKAAAGAAAATGNAAAASVPQIDEATQAQQDWLKSLQQIATGFADPLSIYKGLLDQKTQAEQAAAQKTADSTKSSKDSWKDYVKDVKVSLGDLATAFEKQITDQANWRTNIAKIAQWAGADVANYLAAMGKDGVTLVAQMADGTNAQAQRMARDITLDIKNGGSDWAAGMDQATTVMAAIGGKGGKATAWAIANQLGIGVDVVAGIAMQYGIKLARGINPLLTGLGKPHIAMGQGGAGGSTSYADGGYTGHGGKYTPAGIVHKGEFVMPQEAVKRIGVGVLGSMAGLPGYASGGFVNSASVPHPSSTAPYRFPISTPADAGMAKEYGDTVAWMKQNVAPPIPGGSGVERWRATVDAVLRVLGQSLSLDNGILALIRAESGGNPNAINLWDSNARAGHPSQGLMQTIPSTFYAYAGPYGGRGITDPFANIYAGVNYALHRYGSSMLAGGGRHSRGGSYVGYFNGVDNVPHDDLYRLHSGERVMTREQNAAYTASREMSGRGGSGASGSVTMPAPIVKVYLDGQEWRGMARVEAEGVVVNALTGATDRGRYNS